MKRRLMVTPNGFLLHVQGRRISGRTACGKWGSVIHGNSKDAKQLDFCKMCARAEPGNG